MDEECVSQELNEDNEDGCFPSKKAKCKEPEDTRGKHDFAVGFTPKDPAVAEYCERLIHCKFHGETSNIFDEKTDHSEDDHVVNMGAVLRALDGNLRHYGKDITGNEEDVVENLQFAAQKRAARKEEIFEKIESLKKDMTRFVRIYHRRTGLSDKLHHKSYWGTRQQLLAGKVIADWVDPDNGPLDPLFGALLCPPAGRTGAGDSTVVHKMFFDEKGPTAFHSAVHDAFGYLINFHETGPGYDYLGATGFFETHECLSGQVAGLRFWRKLLDKKHKQQIADTWI